ncbi:unnamed protein product [Ranitomeya imitator]|uniref:Tc1-like transposase DDE domain-containing protein n=1 Tax=Ranitomeya imitator TaxID=111125 RepID=A0ABN9MM86_9NEOB|nr:unnamed protein product [Ranitomeya imitator]
MQDNARSHVAGVCQPFQQDESIEATDWPARSPDLNPIEHIWDIMSHTIHQRHVVPQTVQELADALVQVWEKIPQETISRLIRSMPRHFREIIQARWGESIDWAQTYEEALAKSREAGKPLMVIHHLEDCPFSQELKKAFSLDAMAQKLARDDFIMLNVVHPVADENQSPDGLYVPRVLFVDPSMTVRTDLAGRYSNRLYAYEAGDIPELVTNMKKAKNILKTEL